jgi:hypothetical protein
VLRNDAEPKCVHGAHGHPTGEPSRAESQGRASTARQHRGRSRMPR